MNVPHDPPKTKGRLPDAEGSSVIVSCPGFDPQQHATLLHASASIEKVCNAYLDRRKLTVCDSDTEYAALVLVVLTPLVSLGVEVGWSSCDTGGGCTALYHIAGEGYAYITDTGGCSIPDANEPCWLGFYTKDGEIIATENPELCPTKDGEQCSTHANLHDAQVAFRERLAVMSEAAA